VTPAAAPLSAPPYNARVIDEIRQRLARYQPSTIDDVPFARAAVLLPLYERDGIVHVLFTRRSELVEHHKGQISFPGGAHDPGDADLRDTAARETWEEIGVAIEHIDIFAQLDEMVSVSNFLVTPFVGRITEPGPYPFVHSEVEVAEILEVPLDHLRDAANLTVETQLYQGREREAYAYRWRDHVIWGLTARILRRFLELIA
jgi:8-oxo-dGTP pyrophosphatase MutT (NUDIX family)